MSKLKNKVAVVTGASSKEGADSVVKAITGHGGVAISVQADVTRLPQTIKNLSRRGLELKYSNLLYFKG